MNLANNLSLFRIFLVPVFVTSLVYYDPAKPFFHWIALAAFVAACVTDALDGWLARRLNEVTQLGSYIDPIADKLLLVSGFFALTFLTNLPPDMRIPAWVTIPIMTRDAVILIGATIIFITTGSLEAAPLFIGKATTVIQMLTLFAALTRQDLRIQITLQIVTLLLTALSGVRYVRLGGKLIQP